MDKKTENGLAELFAEFVGFIMLLGMAIGLVIAGIIWGTVEFFQWIF